MQKQTSKLKNWLTRATLNDYPFVYEPAALAEYKDAISWYLAKSEIAAINFIKEVKDKIAIICNDPLRYKNTYKDFRETAIKKFPYSIVYFVDEVNKVVIIAAVYHQKRAPKRKFRKTK